MLTCVLMGRGERGDVAMVGRLVLGNVVMVKRLLSCGRWPTRIGR